MSSGAKRLVQSLRGRTGGGGRSVGGGGGSTRSDGFIGDVNVVGSAGSSTSATRLCHYDSGHELDEISVVGGGGGIPVTGGIAIGSLQTPTTPCHCTAHKYGSGQTLYSIAGLPPRTSSTFSQSSLRKCFDQTKAPKLGFDIASGISGENNFSDSFILS
ncbi:hypothetical protein M0802_013790 [Mischocyttarus mexicanus]|nr:hypothetical protein M0802_013790 [Mischocyttarus mexicanus]